MVTRLFLTARAVDTAEAPITGERWIADTRIKGFGLRLWRNPKGQPMSAYGVRVSDLSGKSRRRTLSYWECYKLYETSDSGWSLWFEESKPTLGNMIQTARNWAFDEIASIKGLPTISDEERMHREHLKSRVGTYTFQRAADILVQGNRNLGRSQEYCDRLYKLFFLYVPDSVKSKKLHEISEIDIREIFSSTPMAPSNMRVLRSFVRRCLEISSRYGETTKIYPEDIPGLVEKHKNIKICELQWSEKNHLELLKKLLDEDTQWAQALCLIVFIESNIPLSPLMKAQWKHYYIEKQDSMNKGYRNTFLILRDHWRYELRLSEVMSQAVLKCIDRCGPFTSDDDYIFASNLAARKSQSITSVGAVWSKMLRAFSLPQLTPLEFRNAWQQHEEFLSYQLHET